MKGQKFIPLLVIAAGLLAYHNSFTGEFVHDDLGSIPENPTIQHLWPIWQCLSPPHQGGLTVEGRPFINLSLAINYALGGYNVWGYHVLNLAVHILAGLTLLGIVRRTLLQPRLRSRFGNAANELALATAVLWTVHPLQTESVTYIVQRAESMMGLFYLLTLYCFIRGVESPLVARSTRDEPRTRLWYGLSVTACALGMASKEVMVSAPVMVLLYDRAFVSGSLREVWRRRWPLYLALAGTWILLAVVLAAGQLSAASTSAQRAGLSWWQYLKMLSAIPRNIRGTNRIGFTWWQYLATEPGVILYYLRLSVWPSPLCVHHAWPIARTWMSILPPAAVVVILLGASAWAWRTNPAWGFVGAWFFLILAPSSSFMPIHDPLYEHRMYLSLVVVVSLMVMGLYSLMGRQSLAVFIVVAIGLGFLTWRRNQDYRNEVALYSDAAAKFPNDLTIHYTLGVALQKTGRIQEAIDHYEQAVGINPNIAEVHNNLGVVLEQAGKINGAIGHYEQALQINPDFAEAQNNLGNALREMGKATEAIGHYERALRIKPDYAKAEYNLGLALEKVGRVQEALGHYEQALRLAPDFTEAHYHLGVALVRLGRVQEAVEHWTQALRLKPDFAEAHNNLGSALLGLGRVQEAIEHYEQALRLTPGYAKAHYNLGIALEEAGRVQEALGHYEQALRLAPDFAEAQKKLARLRSVQ